jgi:hypothetical protein
MAKLYKVERELTNCRECPNCQYGHWSTRWECHHEAKADPTGILPYPAVPDGGGHGIPDWCPLPDATADAPEATGEVAHD